MRHRLPKKNAQGYKISWKGYKLHLDTACCGVPISAQRLDACYELMDAAYCSTVIRKDIQAAGRVPLIDLAADTPGHGVSLHEGGTYVCIEGP